MKVLNFGSLNIDYVYTVDHIINPGETENTESVEIFPGGKGLNQSVALAKAGSNVYHAGLIGKDGEMFLDILKKYNINSKHVKTIEKKSGHTIIQLDKNGQNSILLYAGANRKINPEFVDSTLSDFDSSDVILLQNEINMLDLIIEKSYEKNMKIVLNPSPFNDYLKKCDLKKISMFLLNEIEAYQLTGKKQTDEIIKSLMEKFPSAKFVLTLGEKGSVYFDKNQRIAQDIFRVKAVDTTAAGDTFTGYFLTEFLKDKDIKNSLITASKASAIAVTRKGATSSIPSIDEVLSYKF